MKHMNVKLGSVIGVLALGLGAYLYNTVPISQAAGSDTKPPTRAVAVPTWELKDLNGKTVKSSDFKGKVVILDFWATWCVPCLMEIPGFVELQKTYGAKGLLMVGIALDEEGAKLVKPFASKAGINYTVLIGDNHGQRIFGDVEVLPTTFILDRQGKVVRKHIGFTPKEAFEKEIIPLLSL